MKKIIILICALFGLVANSLTKHQKSIVFSYTTIEFFAEHCSDEYKVSDKGIREYMVIQYINIDADGASKLSSVLKTMYGKRMEKAGTAQWCNALYKEAKNILPDVFFKK